MEQIRRRFSEGKLKTAVACIGRSVQ